MPEATLQNRIETPAHVRVSIGTAIVLGLTEGKLDAEPTTAYLMTYKTGKCSANCRFCPQARTSESNTELLSRVTWPSFSTKNVLEALKTATNKGKIKRICLQALNYPSVFASLRALVKEIKKHAAVPISVSCQPLNRKNIELLAEAGVDRLGIALDAATKVLFDEIKGKNAGSIYSWDKQFSLLNEANSVLGKGNVSTHLIVGLGETEKEAAEIIQKCVDMSVLPALFAFTPVRGTAMEKNLPPSIESYRRIQLARHLIVNGKTRVDEMEFTDNGTIARFGVTKQALEKEVECGFAFRTSGCPNCNRPFYNEKPSGPIYNYPSALKKEEKQKIKRQLHC